MKEQIVNSRVFGDFLLVLTAVIWGSGFPITNLAVVNGITPMLLVALRFLIGTLVMGLIFFNELRFVTKQELKLGLIAGSILAVAFILQTYGIKFTSPSNNAFLTTANVIMVPFVSWVVFKQRPSVKIILLALMCFSGMAVLSWSSDLGISFNLGDILTLLCAACYAGHISFLGYAARKMESPARLNLLQMLFCGVISLGFFLAVEAPTFSAAGIGKGLLACVYLAIFPTALCFFMQTWVQKRSPPTRVAVILSLEGFFGSLISVAMGYDPVTRNLVVGGAIIVSSVVLTQVDFAQLTEKFRNRTECGKDNA